MEKKRSYGEDVIRNSRVKLGSENKTECLYLDVNGNNTMNK